MICPVESAAAITPREIRVRTCSISEPEYFDYLEQNRVFEEIAIYRGRDRNLVTVDGEPQRVVVACHPLV